MGRWVIQSLGALLHFVSRHLGIRDEAEDLEPFPRDQSPDLAVYRERLSNQSMTTRGSSALFDARSAGVDSDAAGEAVSTIAVSLNGIVWEEPLPAPRALLRHSLYHPSR